MFTDRPGWFARHPLIRDLLLFMALLDARD